MRPRLIFYLGEKEQCNNILPFLKRPNIKRQKHPCLPRGLKSLAFKRVGVLLTPLAPNPCQLSLAFIKKGKVGQFYIWRFLCHKVVKLLKADMSK